MRCSRHPLRLALVLVATVVLGLLQPSPAMAQTEVDLELVIAVDVSLSMDLDEQRVQRDGYIGAFRHPEIHKAIVGGPLGRIAVTYVEWAGIATQNVVIPWRLIDSPQAAEAFARDLSAQPISRHRMTSITGAIQVGVRLIEQNAFKGTRRVIDISGDGPNNSGGPVEQARDEAVEKGITINGLPILLKSSTPSGFFDIRQLDKYYTDCVIGGVGAFMIPVTEEKEFPVAIRKKLLLEISGITVQPRVIRTQATKDPEEKIDCLIGEKMWLRYMDGRGFR